MLKIKRLSQLATLPTVAHPGEDLAYDLYAAEDVTLEPGRVAKVKTGIAASFDTGQPHAKFGLLIRDRSSMASKGITVSGGVVDAGYTGEIAVLMTLEARTDLRYESCEYGVGLRFNKGYQVKAGDKIAQMIPMLVLTMFPIQEVESLEETARAAAGFGSTGK